MLGLYVNVRWIDEAPRRQANKHVSSWLGSHDSSLHSKSHREHANRVRLQAPYKQALATYPNPLKEAGPLWEVVALIIAVFRTWSLGPCSLTPVSLSYSLSFLLPVLSVLSSISDQLLCALLHECCKLHKSNYVQWWFFFFFLHQEVISHSQEKSKAYYNTHVAQHSVVWLNLKGITVNNVVICVPPLD